MDSISEELNENQKTNELEQHTEFTPEESAESTVSAETPVDPKHKDAVDPKRKMEAQMWIQTVLGTKFDGDLFDELQDGTVLCELLNEIKPGTCNKYKPSKSAWIARNNISI